MKALSVIASTGGSVAAIAFVALAPAAAAYSSQAKLNNDDVSGSSWNQHFVAKAEKTQEGDTIGVEDGPATSSPWDTRLVKRTCANGGSTNFCMAYACGDPDEVGYLIQRRLRARPESGWNVIGETCIAPNRPTVTPGMILEEIRRIGLPAGSVQVPPETFVNYDTVVYADAETFTRTVTLLGFTVDLEATPTQFHWTYGDGDTETTTTAGRPYPATDITHTWTDAHRTFHPSVDVIYEIRFRVDGGDWQSLADTITVPGPEGDVRIREATGMLTSAN